MTKSFDVAVVGACSSLAAAVLSCLEQRSFPIGKLVLLGSDKGCFESGEDNGESSASLDFCGVKHKILPLSGENVIKNHVDIAIFCCPQQVSKKFAPLFTALSTTVIDSSPAHQTDENVPLVMPQINAPTALAGGGIIAAPACRSVLAASILHPLAQRFGVSRVALTSLEAADNEGKMRGNTSIVPRVGEVLPGGYTDAEQRLCGEVARLLGGVSVSAVCAALPALGENSMFLNVELSCTATPADVERVLAAAGIELLEMTSPMEICGRQEIYSMRVRRDFSHPNTFNIFATCDNLAKPALTLVQIAELFL